ncbi:response regulator transcription factor [Deinococcus soli (ex Cha et al. 2016)]|uniref:response regulator transcription factor n=1 Tax=Deinococcus soli (ex Cha et al. 2016) TaxID=1309411 RepID=UPI001662BFFA|nr:response regulator transcription factor [Deinococcus soli (ex Cha et al. 2016)]GGB84155.1 DNA-binding response regulator [Deinococcus soli (ex Cha et al. 2016)]
MRVLLVEDEAAIAQAVMRALAAQGYGVRHAPDLEAARDAFPSFAPDLAVLDVGLPGFEDGGFVLAREARSGGFSGPILFLTARDALDDKVHGLDSGGDDYLVKPFELPELLARVRALLRRVTEARSARLVLGELELDLAARHVTWQGGRVALTPREYAVLERLALHPSRVYAPEELLDLIWGEEASGTGVVKVCVHHLRAKIAAGVVRTEALGYRLGVGG